MCGSPTIADSRALKLVSAVFKVRLRSCSHAFRGALVDSPNRAPPPLELRQANPGPLRRRGPAPQAPKPASRDAKDDMDLGLGNPLSGTKP